MKNFTNKGTIESKDDHAALRLQGAKIETFKNEKLISATGNAVAIKIERNGKNAYDGSIGTFINETNGTISAAGQGAVSLAHATITSFENKGLIENTSSSGNLNIGTVHAAIYLHEHGHTTIKSFDNQGTIKGGDYVCFLWLSLAHSDINALLMHMSLVKNEKYLTMHFAATLR